MPPRLGRSLLAVALLAALLVALWATSGPPAPLPEPVEGFAFAALGDAPYYPWEELRYRLVHEDLSVHELAWVLHVGDVFWRPCTETLYREALERFETLRHPVVYTPGDNEWTDCWEPGSGGYDPLERLQRIREIFFAEPDRSLGGGPMPLVSQGLAGQRESRDGRFEAFVENARWEHQGVVFATVHLVGTWNGREPFPGRTEAHDREAERRTAAATAWLRQTVDRALATGARALVLAFHAAPGLSEPADDPYRRTYEPFLAALEIEAERFDGPILLIHGDDHDYTVDRPLVNRATGRPLENVTRLQLPGSPDVGWVRVVVNPPTEESENPDDPFAFEPRVVPRWKHW